MRQLLYILILIVVALICGCFYNNNGSLRHFVPRGELTNQQTFGQYTVRTYFTNDGSFEILKSGRRVFGRHGHIFRIGLVEYGKSGLHAVRLDKDLTGDGRANLVITEWSGGAHCCYDVFVFELGRRFRLLATIDGRHGSPRFEDLDQDSDYEVIVRDWTYAYWPGCFASSPAPRVILRWDGNRYAVACDLMHFPRPSVQQVETKVKEIRTLWGKEYNRSAIPVALWGYSLELMYGGYEDLGWQFIELAWTDKYPFDSKLVQELRSLMAKSPYWKELQSDCSRNLLSLKRHSM